MPPRPPGPEFPRRRPRGDAEDGREPLRGFAAALLPSLLLCAAVVLVLALLE